MVGAAPAPACRSAEHVMRSKRKESPIAESLIIMLICVCILRVYTHKQTCTPSRAGTSDLNMGSDQKAAFAYVTLPALPVFPDNSRFVKSGYLLPLCSLTYKFCTLHSSLRNHPFLVSDFARASRVHDCSSWTSSVYRLSFY
jgi:hypothetical protein